MTEKELYANKLRIAKYEEAIDRAKKIKEQLDEVDKMINELGDKCIYENMLFYENEISHGKVTEQIGSAYGGIPKSIFHIPLLNLSLGRYSNSGYITDKENKEYFRYDMRIPILKTIKSELEKILKNISKYMEWLLECDDDELKHQIRQRAIDESYDEPSLYKTIEIYNPIELPQRVMNNQDFIQFCVKIKDHSKLIEFLKNCPIDYKNPELVTKWLISEYTGDDNNDKNRS